MKIEFQDEDVKAIAREVAEILKPYLFTANQLETSQDTIFTVETLAEYLLTTPKWVYNHIHELPHLKKDGIYRFRKKPIDRLFEEIPTRRPNSIQ